MMLMQNGYGSEYGVSYRTLHKTFELLQLKQRQAEGLAEKLRQGKEHRKRRGKPMTRESYLGKLGVGSIEESAIAKGGEKAKGAVDGKDTDVEMSGGQKSTTLVPVIDGNNSVDLGEGDDVEGERQVSVSLVHSPARIGLEGEEAVGENEDDDDGEEGEVPRPYSYSVEVSMLEIYNEQVWILPGVLAHFLSGRCTECSVAAESFKLTFSSNGYLRLSPTSPLLPHIYSCPRSGRFLSYSLLVPLDKGLVEPVI